MQIKKGFFPAKPVAKKKRKLSANGRNGRPKKRMKLTAANSPSTSVNRVNCNSSSSIGNFKSGDAVTSRARDHLDDTSATVANADAVASTTGDHSDGTSATVANADTVANTTRDHSEGTSATVANADTITSTASDHSDRTSTVIANADVVTSTASDCLSGNETTSVGLTDYSDSVAASAISDSGFESQAREMNWNLANRSDDADDKCLACLLNPTNALFLHGKTGHRCCCYRCAKRIWLETQRCPICRSKVANIIRILNV